MGNAPKPITKHAGSPIAKLYFVVGALLGLLGLITLLGVSKAGIGAPLFLLTAGAGVLWFARRLSRTLAA